MKKKFGCLSGSLLFLFVLFCCTRASAAISITVTGSWYETIDKNDLVSGAGSDLQESYTTVSGQVTVDISGAADADDAWRVDIRKIDTAWNVLLHPKVKRTSDGTGGSVSGGSAYQEITDVNTSFFSGAGNVSGIKLQLELTGVSVQIQPSSCSTVVYYTVIDI